LNTERRGLRWIERLEWNTKHHREKEEEYSTQGVVERKNHLKKEGVIILRKVKETNRDHKHLRSRGGRKSQGDTGPLKEGTWEKKPRRSLLMGRSLLHKVKRENKKNVPKENPPAGVPCSAKVLH